MFLKKNPVLVASVSAALTLLSTQNALSQENNPTEQDKRVERKNALVLDSVIVRGGAKKVVADAAQETELESRTTLGKTQLEKFAGLESAVTGALKYTPGVHFAGGDGSGITEGSFTVRGFSQDQFGVIRDGVPVNDPQYGTPHSDFFGDPENYESISVLYGSASNSAAVLTASGGTIDIHTVAPTAEKGLLFKQSLGSNNLRKSFVRANTGEFDGFSAWVSASRTTGDLWTGSAGKLESNRFESNLQYRWGNGNAINAVLSSFSMKSNSYLNPSLADYRSQPYDTPLPATTYTTVGGTNGVADAVNPGASAAARRADFDIQTYGVNGVFRLSDSQVLKVNPYYVRVTDGTASLFNTALSESLINRDLSQDGDKKDTRPVVAQLFPSQYRVGTTGSLDWALNDLHTLQLGLWTDYIHATHKIQLQSLGQDGKPVTIDGSSPITDGSGNGVYLTNKKNLITTQKLWAQDTWNFQPKWSLTGALAWQHTKVESENEAGLLTGTQYGRSASYDRLLPSLKLAYQPDGVNQFYWNSTSNIKTPLPESLYPQTAATTQKAETAWNQELGWRYTTDTLLLSSALFYSQFKNRQASTTVNGVATYVNVGDVASRGLELAVRGKLPHGFSYFGSWTYVDATQGQNFESAGSVFATAGKQLFNSPQNLVSLGAGYDDGLLYGNLLARYTGAFYGDLTNQQKIDGYTVVDLNGGYRFKLNSSSLKTATLGVNLNNLLDKKYLSGVYTGVVSANAATPYYYRGQPRSFLATLSLEF